MAAMSSVDNFKSGFPEPEEKSADHFHSTIILSESRYVNRKRDVFLNYFEIPLFEGEIFLHNFAALDVICEAAR